MDFYAYDGLGPWTVNHISHRPQRVKGQRLTRVVVKTQVAKDITTSSHDNQESQRHNTGNAKLEDTKTVNTKDALDKCESCSCGKGD